MGRSARNDVDYYPHKVKKGKTLFILQNKYKLEGYGFFYKLLDFLAITPFHHYQINNDTDLLYLSGECMIDDENLLLEMIEVMITTGKLDKDLWNDHKVIACDDFLDSVKLAYKDRISECITLAEIKQKYYKNSKTEPETIFPEPETPISSANNPQTKLNKIKLKAGYNNSSVKAIPGARVGESDEQENSASQPAYNKTPEVSKTLTNWIVQIFKKDFDETLTPKDIDLIKNGLIKKYPLIIRDYGNYINICKVGIQRMKDIRQTKRINKPVNFFVAGLFGKNGDGYLLEPTAKEEETVGNYAKELLRELDHSAAETAGLV